jgi:glutamyl-Q tRNA(Asp) synthetase
VLNVKYIGRFAPSPTGPLHLGSLYAALASFLHARACQGQWLLRIDDIDNPRKVAGASESIIDTLQSFGLHWDGPIAYQSNRLENYQTIIEQLITQEQVYSCTCSRKTLSALNTHVYPRTCRHLKHQKPPYSLRLKSAEYEISFDDELQGSQKSNFAQEHGDFIIKRKDGITAYQLAVVIDDHLQNITHVVRGFDLLDSTPKQIALQNILGFKSPHYCHFPIIIDQQGNKLSKQSCAQAVSAETPQKTLFLLLELLQQNPPSQLKTASVQEIISWGIEHWHSESLKLARTKKIRAINDKID